MKEVKTKFGTYSEGEEIVVVMHGLCGRKYVYKGTVKGKRECLGREYLVMTGSDGYDYDVTTMHSVVYQGAEAKRVWAEEHKEEVPVVEPAYQAPVQQEKKAQQQQQQQQTQHYSSSSKYTRI